MSVILNPLDSQQVAMSPISFILAYKNFRAQCLTAVRINLGFDSPANRNSGATWCKQLTHRRDSGKCLITRATSPSPRVEPLPPPTPSKPQSLKANSRPPSSQSPVPRSRSEPKARRSARPGPALASPPPAPPRAPAPPAPRSPSARPP